MIESSCFYSYLLERPYLAKAINELCLGQPSAATEQLLMSLTRRLPCKPTHLLGTNFAVDVMNLDCLLSQCLSEESANVCCI
jgi:hypothetical protein